MTMMPIDATPMFIESTAPIWTFIALAYVLAAIYLRAIDRRSYPTKVWFPMFFVGSSIFLLVNQTRIFQESHQVAGVIEIASMFAVIVLGASLVHLAIENAQMVDRIETYQELLEKRKEAGHTERRKDGHDAPYDDDAAYDYND